MHRVSSKRALRRTQLPPTKLRRDMRWHPLPVEHVLSVLFGADAAEHGHLVALISAFWVEPHACVHFFMVSVSGWLLQLASSVKARTVKQHRDRDELRGKNGTASLAGRRGCYCGSR